MITYEFFESALIVASIALIWKTALKDISRFTKFPANLPMLARKPLTCAFCFTYWVSLIFTLLGEHEDILSSWLTLGFIASALRFAFELMQESVHYLTHKIQTEFND